MRSEEQIRFRLDQLVRKKRERETGFLEWEIVGMKTGDEGLALRLKNQLIAMTSRDMEMPEDKEIEILRWVLQE